MQAHVLNGDALAYKFPIEGQTIICRECLIDGPVKAESFEQFWKQRELYLSNAFNEPEISYYHDVKNEIEKLTSLKSTDIHLWFEHDLFCQTNLWFVLFFLDKHKIDLPLFRVMPPPDMINLWSGFGGMEASDLQNCYDKKVVLGKEDIQLGVDLWIAYSENDLNTLQNLSSQRSRCFPFLDEVVMAHLQRFPEQAGRPQNKLRELRKTGVTDFKEIFSAFSKTEGIYGFGDTQVKKMLSSI